VSEEPRDPDAGADAGPADEHGSGGSLRGLDLARDALAAARARALASGVRPGSPAGAPGSTGDRRRAGTGRRTSWAARHDPDEQIRSGPGPDERDPQSVGSTIERLTAEHGWSTELAVGGVLGRWEHVVGADVAAHCSPEAFDDGVLVVRTDSTAWATQVRLLAPTLVRRLAEELGHDVVRRVVVRGPAAPSWRKGGLHVRGRGPRDTYG
jgi:predicted nucleic acid-binding Zn ribbon protein